MTGAMPGVSLGRWGDVQTKSLETGFTIKFRLFAERIGVIPANRKSPAAAAVKKNKKKTVSSQSPSILISAQNQLEQKIVSLVSEKGTKTDAGPTAG